MVFSNERERDHHLSPSRRASGSRSVGNPSEHTHGIQETPPGGFRRGRRAPPMAPASPSDGCPSCPVLPGHRLVCVFTTSGLYLKPHLKVFHSTEYLSLLNSPPHIFFIKQAPKTTNLPVALKVSVYKPLETVRNSLITFSKEVTVYRYTNKCHIRCLSPSNEILTQGERE